MNYSKRIQTIIDLLEPGEVLADIGCDHGYVSIGAIQSGKFSHAIAADILPGPLKKAEEAITSNHLNSQITLRLSDGFHAIDEPVDTAVICGMGGLLILDILQKGKCRLSSVNQLVLGPHSEVPALRSFIRSLTDFQLTGETVLRDGNKYYTLLHVKRCNTDKNVKKPISSEASEPPSESSNLLSDELLTEYGDPALQTDLAAYCSYLRFILKGIENLLQKLSRQESSHAAATRQELLARRKKLLTMISCADRLMQLKKTKSCADNFQAQQ